MTAVTDAKLIIETALGHTVTNDLLLRIAAAYTQADPHSLANFIDPENPTNEEMAQVYINTLVRNGKDVVGQVSDINADETASTQKDTDRATAESDWN